jgi:uncharacterized cupredoxin-like copper-binding protein
MFSLDARRTAAVAALVAAGTLAACGGGGNDDEAPAAAPKAAAPAAGGGTVDRLSAAADGALAFDTTTLSAKAGKVTLRMANPQGSGQPHGISIEGAGVDADGTTVDPGGTATVTATLKAGRYTFYCPVPGHRQAGMQGTLTVR